MEQAYVFMMLSSVYSNMRQQVASRLEVSALHMSLVVHVPLVGPTRPGGHTACTPDAAAATMTRHISRVCSEVGTGREENLSRVVCHGRDHARAQMPAQRSHRMVKESIEHACDRCKCAMEAAHRLRGGRARDLLAISHNCCPAPWTCWQG